MNKRPLYIPVMALFFLVTGLFFPIQIAYIFNVNLFDFSHIINKLTALNLISMALLFTSSALTLKMNKNIFLLLPILNFFIFINNYIVAEYGQHYSHTNTIISSMAFLVISLGFYQKDMHKMFHDLKFRYWLSSKRFTRNMPIIVEFDNKAVSTTTHDISKSGMFIVDKHFGKLYELERNKEIIVKISLGRKRTINMKAKIVRKTMARGTYPQGIGIQFEEELSNQDYKIAAVAA